MKFFKLALAMGVVNIEHKKLIGLFMLYLLR